MDTLTHIVLGACIGEAIAGKRIGKKALFIGAVANSLPDIDFVASFFLPTASDLLAHRGFTHSFLFAFLITPLLAWLSLKWFTGTSGMTLKNWLFFWGLQIFAHLLLDSFNAYGTGWFEPFSHYRVSFNTMYVADPLFTLWPLMAFIALLILNMQSTKRMSWVKFGLGLSITYLLIGIGFKSYADNSVKQDLNSNNIAYSRYLSTPTPLNNMLWYFIAETDSGYYTGYRSIFDTRATKLHHVDRNDSLLVYAAIKGDTTLLQRFSQGYYSCERWHDTVVFNIMRFGEINGWDEEEPKFTCYYYLQYPDDNKLMIQRGRVAKWDKKTLGVFFNRIKGN